MKEREMEYIGDLIHEVVTNTGKEAVYRSVAQKVKQLCAMFPLYAEL
jgi:glycine/serine hydroxymethyltransferase